MAECSKFWVKSRASFPYPNEVANEVIARMSEAVFMDESVGSNLDSYYIAEGALFAILIIRFFFDFELFERAGKSARRVKAYQ